MLRVRDLRLTALLFGGALTGVAFQLIHKVTLASAPEAFWLALGVILSALAMGVSKLVDDRQDGQVAELALEALRRTGRRRRRGRR